MPIRNEEEAAILFLQAHPVFQRAVEMTQMKKARRPGPANDRLHKLFCLNHAKEYTKQKIKGWSHEGIHHSGE